MSEATDYVGAPFDNAAVQEEPMVRGFVLVTGGRDKPLDALHICFEALSELEDGADIEAALRYLIARFSVKLPFQIIRRDP